MKNGVSKTSAFYKKGAAMIDSLHQPKQRKRDAMPNA